MSTRKKKAQRQPFDRYFTPAWVTRALLKSYPPPTDVVIEPCAGDGAIVRELCEVGYTVDAFDLVDHPGPLEAGARTFCQCDWPAAMERSGDLVQLWPYSPPVSYVMNPPFGYERGIAQRFLEAALKDGRAVYTAALLPLKIECSAERLPFWQEWGGMLEAEVILPERPRFSGTSSYFEGYKWFVFTRFKDTAARPKKMWVSRDEVP